MTSRYGLACLVVFIAAILLGIENYETWKVPLKGFSMEVTPKKAGTKLEAAWPLRDQKDFQEQTRATSSVASYIFISDRNPFSPDRKEFPIITPVASPSAAVVKQPIARPQVTLYGLAIAGDYRSASLSYAGRQLQKGEREVMTVRIGDQVAGYKVVKISEDRIVLETQGDNFEVLLYDVGAPKKRAYAKTENKPGTMTSAVPPPEPSKPTPSKDIPSTEGISQVPNPIPLPSGTVPAQPQPSTAVTPPSPPSSSPNASPYARSRRNQMIQQTPPSGDWRYPSVTPPAEQ